MELGENARLIVFDDADIDAAVQGAFVAKMLNIGEACTSATRFHIADKVADQFAEKMGAMKVCRGSEEGVEVGPLIDNSPAQQGDRTSRGCDRARRSRSSAAAPATAPATSSIPRS
jgi:acyl-CoA reductase-like NAD-dependent aldehyde dehydrogenase